MYKKKLVIGITAPQSIILLKGQLKFMARQGYEVYLLAPETKNTIEFCKKEDATLIPIDIKRDISIKDDVRTLYMLVKMFRRIKPDIINLGTPKISLLGMIAARICKVPKRIYTCRGFRFEHEKGVLRNILLYSEKIISQSAHKIIAISQSVKDLGISEGLFSEKKCVVINKGSSNGVELEIFAPEKYSSKEIEDIRTKLNLENCFVYGYVGRIVKRKGFEELIEAFFSIYNEDNTTRLVVCGSAYYDQIEKRIIEKAEQHPGVILTGLIPYEDVPKYLLLFDTFVLPAYWEGFGNVLIQAAAMGVPVISTNVTGCKDAVSDGFNGELIPSKSINKLSKAMTKFKGNEGMRKKYGRNGKNWAENFKGEEIWLGMIEVYEQ